MLGASQAASGLPVLSVSLGAPGMFGHTGDGACVNPSFEGKFSGLACLALLELGAPWAVATADWMRSIPACLLL